MADRATGGALSAAARRSEAPPHAAASGPSTAPRRTPSARLAAAVAGACAKIAPLWPLEHFVAVNPFLGFTGRSFAATCATLPRIAKVDMLMPRHFYRDALESGRITDADLAAGLGSLDIAGKPMDAAGLRAAAALPHADGTTAAGATRTTIATVAEVLDALAQGDTLASRTAFMIDEISKWCAAYFDEGQAAWRSPWRNLSPYAAWRAQMREDRNPEMFGLRGFRRAVAALPQDPLDAIGHIVDQLGIPDSALDDYLHRALFDIRGWASYAGYQVHQDALRGQANPILQELLAIRVAWGYALFLERDDPEFHAAWRRAMAQAGQPAHPATIDPDLRIDLALQESYEAGYRRRLLADLQARAAMSPDPNPPAPRGRPLLQAAFCIDVRSEPYRRALETVLPDAETIGFAGFFGVPIEYVPIGRECGGAHCPALMAPGAIICEAVTGATPEQERSILNLRLLRRRAAKTWKAFKLSAISTFTYVETAGLLFAGKLLADTTGRTRPVQHPDSDGLDARVFGRMGPRLEPGKVGGRSTGLQAEQRLDMAEAVLRGMSLSGGFARLVLLAGHGSTTVNNPYASALDCGACGGHTGEANARVAAGILNDPQVRAGLGRRGVAIPGDTWFIAGLHDTTTDDVRLFIPDPPPTHAADIATLREALDNASSLARRERAVKLGLGDGSPAAGRLRARSRDWSQLRPEWGLAGNAAFIAAPRYRTRGLNLDGRCFLHSYDWRSDRGFGVLELIMTAPLVVASWINLQYYGCTVDNRAFGSGNKTLHNVVGQIGVLEGNAGDLRAGLPRQSVHDGRRHIHEPLRLQAFIEAPCAQIDRVLAEHAEVRDLVENRWIQLFAIDADGRTQQRRAGGWTACGSPVLPAPINADDAAPSKDC